MTTDPEMRSDVYAALKITDPELDPDEVTAYLGMAPSKTWRVGDPVIPGAKLREKANGWLLKSGLPLAAPLEEHIRSLMELLQPVWPALVELCNKRHAEIYCVVYSYGGDRPGIFFDRDAVRRAADLNADIDVDLYILP